MNDRMRPPELPPERFTDDEGVIALFAGEYDWQRITSLDELNRPISRLRVNGVVFEIAPFEYLDADPTYEYKEEPF